MGWGGQRKVDTVVDIYIYIYKYGCFCFMYVSNCFRSEERRVGKECRL